MRMHRKKQYTCKKQKEGRNHQKFTHSHAEAAFASRRDAHITDDVGVVEPIIEAGEGIGRRGLGGDLLMRGGRLEEAGGDAKDGEEGEKRKVGASHG